jgi:hypothetical protein
MADSGGVRFLTISAEDSGDFLRLSVVGRTNRAAGVEARDRVVWKAPVDNPHASFSLAVEDSAGNRAVRTFAPGDFSTTPRIHAIPRWGRDWVFVDVRSSQPLRKAPVVIAVSPPIVVAKLETTMLAGAIRDPVLLPPGQWPPQDYMARWENGADGTYAVTRHAGNDTLPVIWEAVGKNSYRLTIPLSTFRGDGGVLRILADGAETEIPIRGTYITPHGGTYSRPDLGLHVTLPAGSVGEPVFLRVAEASMARPHERELQPVGRAFRIEPQDQPIAEEIMVTMRIPDGVNPTGVALYETTNGRLRFLTASFDTASRSLRGKTRLLATVGLFRDTTPPRLSLNSPQAHGGRFTVSGRVHDDGSGLSQLTDPYEVRIDGKWVPAAPTADGRFSYQQTTPMPSGRHVITVVARDLAGNVNSARTEIVVR